MPVAESVAAGREARQRVSRSAQGAWEPGPKRTGPLEILAEQDRTRVPELVPVRYGRMLASAFTFYRGAAGIMAADLGSTPDSGLQVQLCGDAHLSNFGVFQAPDRRLVFDINDFDETLPGPFEWDVKRLAARWGDRVTKTDRRRLQKNVAKARNKDSLRALEKLTESRDGELRIADRPPLLVPIAKLAEREGVDAGAITDLMKHLLSEYRGTLDHQARVLAERYHYVDAAHKVVGVGSVGTRAWIVLLLGRDAGDPLFLQVKEAGASVLEPFAGASRFRHHGHRVVAGQRLTQAAGDVLLGWLTVEGLDGKKRDFYVRQLWDGKGSAEIEAMGPETMAGYAELCGWGLARAHARTGDRAAISAYLGKSDAFDQAIAEFSEAYADQNEDDYKAVLSAESSGQLQVESGV